jgi:hypothetical protein
VLHDSQSRETVKYGHEPRGMEPRMAVLARASSDLPERPSGFRLIPLAPDRALFWFLVNKIMNIWAP